MSLKGNNIKYKKVKMYRTRTYNGGKWIYHYYFDNEFAKSLDDSFGMEDIVVRVPVDTEEIILKPTK